MPHPLMDWTRKIHLTGPYWLKFIANQENTHFAIWLFHSQKGVIKQITKHANLETCWQIMVKLRNTLKNKK